MTNSNLQPSAVSVECPEIRADSAFRFIKAVRKSGLPATLRVVAYALASRADNKTGRCFASYRTLMADTGIASKATISRAIADLFSEGSWHIIGKIVGQRPCKRGLIYVFELNEWLLGMPHSRVGRRHGLVPVEVTSRHQGGRKRRQRLVIGAITSHSDSLSEKERDSLSERDTELLL